MQAEYAKLLKEYQRIRLDAVEDFAYLAEDPNAPREKLCRHWTDHGCCCYDEHGKSIGPCPGFEWRGLPQQDSEFADVSFVVFCKDCVHATMTSDGLVKYCDVWDNGEAIYMSGNNFCSFGEGKNMEAV